MSLSGDPNSSHNQWTQRRCGRVGGKVPKRKPQAAQSSYFEPDRCGPRWGSRRAGRACGSPGGGGGRCERPAGTEPPGRAYPFCLREIGETRAEGPRAHGSSRGRPGAMWPPEHPPVKTPPGKASAHWAVQGLQTGSPRANSAHLLVSGARGVRGKWGPKSPGRKARTPSSPRRLPLPWVVLALDRAAVGLAPAGISV